MPNPSSVGLHESLGFVPVGVYRHIGFKFDRWHDVAWLQLRLRDDARPASDPLPLADAVPPRETAALFATCAAGVRTAR
jgi:phosphinothricin acetyltransferase